MKGEEKRGNGKREGGQQEIPPLHPPTGEGGAQFALTQRSVLETGGGGIDDILLERVKKRERVGGRSFLSLSRCVCRF